MNVYEQNKLIQIVLYILNKTGGIDYYHLFKLLYFAELEHLAKWGCRITSDNFHALEYGPVPSCLYDAVKACDAPKTNLDELLHESAHFAGNDAPNVLMANVPVNMDYISASEKEALDQSIKDNTNLTFGQLKAKSHDSAWKEAYQHINGTNVMSPISMAKVMNADEATIEYLKEQLALDDALA